MALQRVIRNISLILFVIVIKCQTSTTRADDDDDDFQNDDIDNSSEEYIEPGSKQSASSSLFSTVATMRVMSRPPRGISKNEYIHETLCASDGEYYPNMQAVVDVGQLMHNSFCETGCGKPPPDPCPRGRPVCTGKPGNYSVYEDECQLNRTRCDRWNEPHQIVIADVSHCQLESCGRPQPHPCPRRVPVCAGYPGHYRVYEDECQLNQTRCERQGNDLEPIIITKIGSCQVEVNTTRLTCHEILRGMCPRGTTSSQVCNVTTNKTFKNICRALHKRCKKQDDTCYHLEISCGSYTEQKHGSDPPRQDCSRFIRHSFPIVDIGRPCYDMSTSRKTIRNCRCSKSLFPAPDVPEFPSTLMVQS